MDVRCPTCGRSSRYIDNPHRPFCSMICKGKDLFQWVEEGYRISTPIDRPEDSHEEEHEG